MKQLGFIILFTFSSVLAFSQGTVKGKITDGNGETIIGATIMLKSNMSFGTITDLDGNYSLKIADSIPQILIISAIGLQKIEVQTQPMNGEVIVKNVVLTATALTVKEVEITGKAVRAKEYYVEKIKQNSATTLDYVSSETMKKTGDANVTAAITRVAGVSTNSGGLITVRGIGDRYVKTTINGSRIPTLDPFTNNIKLDMFPASLVDNVTITKTASPDISGDWAGAYISVETKDYPEKLSINFENTVGYNSQSTFKDIITSEKSSTDWLGYDDGYRDYNHDGFAAAIKEPSQYQELVALGLGDYYKSMGITGWVDNSDIGNTYYKLGLVKLGLLGPAQFNEDDAFKGAKNLYLSGLYKTEAFRIINTNAATSGQSFADNWNIRYKQAPLNFSQSFSIGNQTKLFGKPLGFLLGYRYGSSIVYDPAAITNRATVVGDGSNSNVYIRAISSSTDERNSRETNGWSTLANLAYKFSPNHSVALMFMPNLTGINKARYSVDKGDIKQTVVNQTQFYEQRRQLVYQVKSENYIPGLDLKMDFNASYTNGNSSAPDFKNVQYWQNADGTYQIGGSIGDGIHRYFRYLSDNLFDSRLALELPLTKKTIMPRKLKFGGAYQRNNRKSDQYDYKVESTATIRMIENNIDVPLALNYFGINSFTDIFGQQQNALDLYYTRINSPANHTFGNSEIKAGYVMLDYFIISGLRFSGGLRVEKAYIYTDVSKFDSLGLAPNDLRREYEVGKPVANPGKLDEISYLPSVNFVYKLKADELAPVNLRLNFSQTVARPSIRELSDVGMLDYEYRLFVFGNSALKMVHINNYDLRLEDYFKTGDNVSLSVFHKDFKDHIELVRSNGITWQNVDESQVTGIEIEGKKIISKNFDFRANIAIISSNTKFVRTRVDIGTGGVRTYTPLDTVSRPMFGQAPYVVNGILTYKSDSLGLSVSLSYNIQGPRVVISSDKKEVPDVYELPRNVFDIKIAKSIAKHFSASVTVRDFLNSTIRRSYKYSEGYSLDYDKYKFGTIYEFGIAYKL